MLEIFIKIQKEKKVRNKIVENSLQLHAHNCSRFDTWIILNRLPCDKLILDISKNGKGIIESKLFIGYKEQKKQIPQCLHFRCGSTHLK